MTVHRLNAEETSEFQKASLPVHEDFAAISSGNKQVLRQLIKQKKALGY
jgi:hypothetical protein